MFFLVGVDSDEVSTSCSTSHHLCWLNVHLLPVPTCSSNTAHRSWGCVQNELAILEFIHCMVETLDRFFANVCELDLMFNLEMVRSVASPIHLAPFLKHPSQSPYT